MGHVTSCVPPCSHVQVGNLVGAKKEALKEFVLAHA